MASINQKITPHLWYDKEAKEAAKFYTSIFKDSRIKNVSTLNGTPSGTVEIVTFELFGQEFMAISAGPFSSSMSPFHSLFIVTLRKRLISTGKS